MRTILTFALWLVRPLLRVVRKVCFWSHLVLGLTGGLVILLMSVTGVLLGFERQMITAIDGAPMVSAPVHAVRLPLDSLLARNAVSAVEVASVAVRVQAERPVVVRFVDRERAALNLDPYTAAPIVVATDGAGQRFFSAMRRWHRWVGATGGEWRTRLKAVSGAANLGFVLLILSGLWIWWPRNWRWSALRSVTWFRRGLGAKARDFNWHNTIGFWSAIPLLLVAVSGVFISYQWPGRWLDRALGSPEERAAAISASASSDVARGGARGGSGGGEAAVGALAPSAAIASYFTAATTAKPDWALVTITLPTAGDTVATVAVAEGNTYRPDLKSTLTLDLADARVLRDRDYASLSSARQIRAWVRFGHTGEVFGLFGQTIATIVSAGGAVLVLTGIALSCRRFLMWRARR